MTAATADEVKLPPRPLIRTFWRLHRAIVRLTGGRIGLQRPERGAKFGMLRLHTVGRRSGQVRIAMIGYFEEGANLVTLAMNGWGTAEPAWWLNLQANPVATVDLAGGSREIRARAASAEERERLWATFSEYPGWGENLNGLAGRRPTETAVVVLEPRTGSPDGRVGDPAAAVFDPADSGGRARANAVKPRSRRLRARHLWLVPGIGLALFANAQAGPLGVGLVPLLVFGIAPDLPRAIGLRRPGVLAAHNAMHHLALPVAVLIGSVVTGMSPFAYVGALAWLGHIVVGWGTGDRGRSVQNASAGSASGLRSGGLALAPEIERLSVR